MKCGTSALHDLLDRHPEISMAPGKELNFFFGPEQAPPVDPEDWWLHGQWHRGLDWYAGRFDPSAPVRGESSPGYTDPSHPEAPARVRATVPDVRLVYLVRDPFERALSQWRHHVRDGTEPRPAEVALLDPESQYVDRSRYHERIAPYLDLFPADQLLVVVQERLRDHTDREVRRVVAHAGADPGRWRPVGPSGEAASEDGGAGAPARRARLRADLLDRVADDVAALRALLDDPLEEWDPVPAHRGTGVSG